jgi:hypothetical protein
MSQDNANGDLPNTKKAEIKKAGTIILINI